jgi:hypothetical protein
MTESIHAIAQRWLTTTGEDPTATAIRQCGQELLTAETIRLERLWSQTATAHHAKTGAGGALSYLAGMRDGFANATVTITGLSRSQVADHLKTPRRDDPETGTHHH